MVADKPHKDMASTLYAEWISAGVKLSLAGLETVAKLAEATRQTIVSSKVGEPVTSASAATASADAANKTQALDDLKLISGVGPKLEAQLKNHGIKLLNQIAAWQQTEASTIDAELNLNGRILRDDWIGQAAKAVNNVGGQTWQR